MHKLDEQLVQQAQLVLDFNWNGEYTQPGPRLYPHQWSWDSALIAMGYAHYAQDRATTEITHLFDSQWDNGLLPQIVFNSRFGYYFPGIDFWHAERSIYAPAKARLLGSSNHPSTQQRCCMCTGMPKTRQRPRSFSGVSSRSWELGTSTFTGSAIPKAKA